MKKIKNMIDWYREIRSTCRELLWANIYHDTKQGIVWMEKMPTISPGRWAVGYNYLYVMTRILNDIRPTKILEFGLGVSTSLISTYVNNNEDMNITHKVIEHDQNWINYYSKSHTITRMSEICLHDIEWCDKNKDYAKYMELEKTIAQEKYEVISIDAPFGSDRKNVFNRSDIVSFLPDILEKDFVIVYDDANRQGEINTIKIIRQKLEENKIKYTYKQYDGQKNVAVIASDGYKFLCSL